jgi:poly(3-hydroxybutyrate) depolymerase
MLYQSYEAKRGLSAPLSRMAALQTAALQWLPEPFASSLPARGLRAFAETISALELTHRRPAFGIDSVEVDGELTPVREETVLSTPFGTLLRFAKHTDVVQPRILVVPGLAGHFATLVRGTVRTLLPDHEVFVADWHNARDVPVQEGRFGLDEYISHLIEFVAAIGPGTHLMAVCQPCVPALAAAAIMAQDAHPAQPRSMILLAGPVDARINPGRVNEFAGSRSLDELERAVVATVPRRYRGAGRRVYPGFLQAMGFLGLAPRRHVAAFTGLFRDIASGHDAAAARTVAFYDEYFAVLDVAAEFYLETVKTIFMDHDLACGRMQWEGRRVELGAIETALMTIEAENDELCPPGQTQAAQDLCTGIAAERKRHHLQSGVGHYGVFSGTRFEQEIYPEIRRFVADTERLLTPALSTGGIA